MAWIALQETVWTHHKTERLMEILKISDVEAVGHMVSLWQFAMLHRPEDGDLELWGDSGIERAARWTGNPGDFVKAMRDVTLLDRYTIHKWEEHALNFAATLERKDRQREQVRERVKLFRERKKSNVTLGNAPVTQCNADTQPNPTQQTQPNPTKQDIAPSPADSPLPVLVFKCAGKEKSWSLTQDKITEWKDSYPGVDVLSECTKARQWCLDNPTKNKTARGMTSFLGRWLSRAQDSPQKIGAKNGFSKVNGYAVQPNKYAAMEERASELARSGEDPGGKVPDVRADG